MNTQPMPIMASIQGLSSASSTKMSSRSSYSFMLVLFVPTWKVTHGHDGAVVLRGATLEAAVGHGDVGLQGHFGQVLTIYKGGWSGREDGRWQISGQIAGKAAALGVYAALTVHHATWRLAFLRCSVIQIWRMRQRREITQSIWRETMQLMRLGSYTTWAACRLEEKEAFYIFFLLATFIIRNTQPFRVAAGV